MKVPNHSGLEIRVLAPHLHADRVQAITRSVARDLQRLSDVAVVVPEEEGAPGTRGALTQIGRFLLRTFAGADGAGAVDVLSSWVQRDKGIQFELKLPDGTHVVYSDKSADAAGRAKVLSMLASASDRAKS